MSAPLYATGLSRPTALPLPWWLRMLSRLPLWFLYALAALAVWVMRRVVRHRGATVRTNIERSFPHLPLHQRRAIEHGYYRNLSQVLAEVLKMGTMQRGDLQRRVRYSNPQLLRDLTAAGHSVLLLCAHQCNWEWQLLALSGQLQVPVQAAYKPLRGALGERLMRTLRSRFGAELVPAKELLGTLLKRRDARIIAMVADQAPVSSDFKHWTGFLEQATAFYMGPEKIAQATRFAVIFAGMRRIARGHYEVLCEPLAAAGERASAGQITERYARAVERQVIAAPADWLWSHRRWKLPPPS
ncbi:MAG TPA: lysophospholipid acyltransferase family protein [Steroidobacteraceae bacterium]|jgi:KDO2-lipid IV(A) lauroyltransferase|nr:lysophospholipid acyltransferase family protein [Steroidobacteraceae bacterium]